VSRGFKYSKLLSLRLNSLKCVSKSTSPLGMEREAVEVPLVTSVGLSKFHKPFSCGSGTTQLIGSREQRAGWGSST